MNNLVDILATLACLTGGVWLYHEFRRIGLSGLFGAVLALIVLWLLVSLIIGLWTAVVSTWRSRLQGLGDWVAPLVMVVILVIGSIVGWRFWLHRRARHFFDS